MLNIKHFWHKVMSIQFSGLLDLFNNSFLCTCTPFYTTNIIQLSRYPYPWLISHISRLLFFYFIENSLNWQKLPKMIQFVRTLEWISYLTSLILFRYKIKNLTEILASEIFFCNFLYFWTKIRAKFMKVCCFSQINGNEIPGDYLCGVVFFSG